MNGMFKVGHGDLYNMVLCLHFVDCENNNSIYFKCKCSFKKCTTGLQYCKEAYMLLFALK